MAVRHDEVSRGQWWYEGGSAAVRALMMKKRDDWDGTGRRPMAAIAVVRPDDPFEAIRPATGVMLRVRTR